MPTRRQAIRTLSGGLVLAVTGRSCMAPRPKTSWVMTVRGPVPPGQLGLTLPHEHVLVDFIGADQVSPTRYQPDEDTLFTQLVPSLLKESWPPEDIDQLLQRNPQEAFRLRHPLG